MSKFITNLFAAIGALTLFGFIAACFDDSQAGGGNSDLTEAQVQQMIDTAIAPLQDKIDALEAAADSRSPNVLSAAPATTGWAIEKTAAVGDICTVFDYTPSATFPGLMDSASCKSSTGYLLKMPLTAATETVRPALLDDSRLYFTTADCSGDGYVHPDQLGEIGLAQGAVFAIPSNATMYVPAGAQALLNLNTGSVLEMVGGSPVCNTQPPGLTGVLVLDNDVQVTGIEDTYQGPITID